MGVFIGSSVLPAILAVTWTGCTGLGVLFGIVGGLFVSIGTWIYLASQQEPGLEDFTKSTCKQDDEELKNHPLKSLN